MSSSQENFFQSMIEKLSILNGEIPKYDFFEEICHYFDISHAFIYESNYSGDFVKVEYYEMVKVNSLPETLNMKELLGLELFSELCSHKVVLCFSDSEKNSLKEKLLEIFHVSTIIFIPILNQHYELAGFVGLGDRRKNPRHAKAEIEKACSFLTLLANTVKLEMFQKGLQNTEAALGNILDHAGIDIYVNDYYTHDILYSNKSMAEPYGGVDNMLGKKCWKIIFNDKTGPCEFCPQPKLLDENGELNKTYEWDYERPFDKSWFRVLSSSFPWTDGRTAHLVASVDITESKRNQLLIEKIAQFDHLTGLPNRRSLHEDVQLFIEGNTEMGDEWYLLFCDLDGFKNVNDSFGHDAGDVLLKGIADDLRSISTETIKAYRQGGDEFVVILKGGDSGKFVSEFINELFDLFRKKYDYQGNELGCGCSIGVAHFPFSANSAKEIFHLADTAMYTVKKEGRGSVRFYHNGEYITMEEYFNINKL